MPLWLPLAVLAAAAAVGRRSAGASTPPPLPGAASVSDLRAMAVAIAGYACVDPVSREGRAIGDPVFDAVTEGRAGAAGYSACGDLPQYVFQALGLAGPWTNRGDTWRPGRAMHALVHETGDAYQRAAKGLEPCPGDCLFFADPTPGKVSEHVSICERASGRDVVTYDYGRRNGVGRPSSGRVERVLQYDGRGNRVMADGRALHGWVNLARLAAPTLAVAAENDSAPRPLALVWRRDSSRWVPVLDRVERWQSLGEVQAMLRTVEQLSRLANEQRAAMFRGEYRLQLGAWVKYMGEWTWRRAQDRTGSLADVIEWTGPRAAQSARPEEWRISR